MDGDENEGLSTQELAVQMLQKNSIIEPPSSDETLGDQQESVEDVEAEQGQVETPRGGHPAWNEILSVLPEELHDVVAPKLREWDAGVTRRFQEIHSQYEPYKEYEPIIDQGIDVETLSKAVGLFQALNADPQQVYTALGQAYGFSSEQESEYEDDSEYTLPPQIVQQLQRQEQALEQFAEYMQQQQQAEQMTQQEQELDNYLQGLKQAYGEFDEDYVVTLIAAGEDGEVAVRRFQETIGGYQVSRPTSNAPRVMSSSGGGGGVPANLPDPTQLNKKDTQNLVVEMLRLAQQEGN